MTSVFGARRRAEEFNSLVEGTSTGSGERYADFYEIVRHMRDLEAPAPRPEFVTDLRAELMAAADTLLVETPADRLALPPRRTHRERRIAAAVGGVAIVGATTSMALAAQSALPGDMLYPVKRAIENAHTGLSVGDESKGSTLLANATGRLDEVSALSRAGGGDDGAISDTLNAFTDQASEASDLLLQDYAQNGSESSIRELRNFTARSMDTLAGLESQVPADARGAIVHAARVLRQIDAAAEDACPTCGGLGITSIPAGLANTVADNAEHTVVVPPLEVHHSAGHHAHHQQPSGGSGTPGSGTPSVPQVKQPGTTTNATGGGSDPAATASQGSDPVKDLADGLTGGGASEPTSTPSLPGVPDPDDVTSAVTDTLKP